VTGDVGKQIERRGRVVAVVIALSGLLALFAPVITSSTGLPVRFEFLAYFASLAGFLWAMFNIYFIWRARQKHKQG